MMRTCDRGARRAAIALGGLGGILAAAAIAEAHDFWLVPNAFRVAEGAAFEVLGQTSSRFPTSESAVALERIATARVIGRSDEWPITDLSHRGTSLLLRHRRPERGEYIVALTLHPRSVRESADSFRRYLELEGAPDALARIDREGLLVGRDSVTRRYTKYAKTLIHVGSGGPDAFSRIAGHPLEFVPRTAPLRVDVGDTLAVQLLFLGRPAAGARTHADAVDWPLGDGGGGSSTNTIHLTADADGWVRIPITRRGMWNVRTVHVVNAPPGSGADWDTHWATFVFQVDGRRSVEAKESIAADSTAVIATVRRFHSLLEAGDSLNALALLAEDAYVLESGNVETRQQYRDHHLAADVAFARAVRSVRTVRQVVIRDDVAWVSSSSSAQGEFRGRPVNSAGAELMVLVRGSSGWKVSAIHWSSRTRRQGP